MRDLQNLLRDDRLARLERRTHFFEVAIFILTLGLTLTIWMGLRRPSVRADDSSKVLRVRGLIVEDENGRARILIGAPVPKVKDRRRTDEATGLIVLGENGTERVAVGYPTPAPQIGDRIAPRAPLSGIILDDPDGNERGGFGFFDDGRVVLGLDYPGREAVSLAVNPQWGLAGLTITAPQGSKSERAEIAVFKDGTSLLKLADATGTDRAMLMVQDESPAKFLGISPKDNSTVDVGVSWLNPITSRQVTIRTGANFLEDIGKLKP